ncbi:MAG: patatin-like phospholipase family protein [Gemmatimonadaceae bacterium]|nr:patatin-like phospholipase family protein [Gemmatimonadaceae bacterium]
MSKVAFVLSGGGSLGAVQVGMFSALYERGIVPDLLVATSVGAVNAAFIASRPATVATVDELAQVWRSIDRPQVFPANLVTGLLGFVGSRNSLIPSAGLRRLLERNIQLARLEDASIPLHVIAVDVRSGTERRLSRGDAISAVLASAAIPVVFPPVEWNGEQLIDGGAANNTPISHALDLGAEEVYVLPTGYACGLHTVPRSALAMGLHALSLLIQQRLIMEIEALKDRTRLVVLPPPCPLDVSPADFAHAAELMARSRSDARAFLDGVSSEGSAVPPVMREWHGHG